MGFPGEQREWQHLLTSHSAPYSAPHIGHQQHLCYMCDNGSCSLDQVKELVKNAKFICRKCGRAAVHEENLCEPVPL